MYAFNAGTDVEADAAKFARKLRRDVYLTKIPGRLSNFLSA